MGSEVDLLVNYPRTKRSIDERGATKTEADRAIARKFGREFFDGDRSQGYGGFNYMPRFWQPVVPTFREHFGLKARLEFTSTSGCAKEASLRSMIWRRLHSRPIVKGIDISDDAVAIAMLDMKPMRKSSTPGVVVSRESSSTSRTQSTLFTTSSGASAAR